MEPRAQARIAQLPYALHPRMLGHQLVFAAFLLTQILDGILTYAGISAFGIAAEGNPLLGWLMASYGELIALAGAKILAAGCGVALYILAVDRLIAVLTLVYIGAALIPWTLILF
ncbi:MAG: hypothetical protein H0X44_04465 [Acidobacteria bacterium]|nr:hypothetical protein [Acidobacteriota bacterium]